MCIWWVGALGESEECFISTAIITGTVVRDRIDLTRVARAHPDRTKSRYGYYPLDRRLNTGQTNLINTRPND